MRAKRVFLAAIGFALLALSWPAAPGLAAEWEGTQEREAVLGLSRAFRAAAEYGIPRTVCIRIRLGDKEGFGSGEGGTTARRRSTGSRGPSASGSAWATRRASARGRS